MLVYTIYQMIGGCYYGKDDAQKDRQELRIAKMENHCNSMFPPQRREMQRSIEFMHGI